MAAWVRAAPWLSFRAIESGWDKNVKATAEVALATSPVLSDVAAVRVDNGTVSIFYQPGRKTIGQYIITTSGRITLGIPTTGITSAEK